MRPWKDFGWTIPVGSTEKGGNCLYFAHMFVVLQGLDWAVIVLASQGGHLEVAKVLLAAGADIEAKVYVGG